MSRHVTYREAADDLLAGSWGKQAADPRDMNRQAGFDEMIFIMTLDVARSLRRLLQILECPNTRMIPERLRLIEKNTRKIPKTKRRLKRK